MRSPIVSLFYPLRSGEVTRVFVIPPVLLMPFTQDPRKHVTLNLYADEYVALQADAQQAGYTSPGTYALALVRARGDAPEPIHDRVARERLSHLQGQNEWLLRQFEALQTTLRAAGIPFKVAPTPGGEPQPRSWTAQERAVEAAVAQALDYERAHVARQAAKAAAAQPPASRRTS